MSKMLWISAAIVVALCGSALVVAAFMLETSPVLKNVTFGTGLLLWGSGSAMVAGCGDE